MGGSEGRERRSSSDTSEHSSVDRPSVSRALSGAFREHPLQGALGELSGSGRPRCCFGEARGSGTTSSTSRGLSTTSTSSSTQMGRSRSTWRQNATLMSRTSRSSCNARAPNRSRVRDADAYLPILGALGRARIFLARPIPHAAVASRHTVIRPERSLFEIYARSTSLKTGQPCVVASPNRRWSSQRNGSMRPSSGRGPRRCRVQTSGGVETRGALWRV